MAIRVLIVDDSALMRKLLVEFLASDPEIEVIGTAPDPYVARDKIKALNPDVLTLDIEMPRMDGLTFLENLMRLRPMPVVMVSSLTEKGAEATMHALELGAIDFVTKPRVGLSEGIQEYGHDLIEKIKMAARARVRGMRPQGEAAPARLKPRSLRTTDKIIAIGASTGGTEAIKEVLEVCEAADGQQINPGHVYIAPGDRHLWLMRDGARYVCRLSDDPPENRHRPSVDYLFKSIAKAAGANAVGAILTGMGDDGARGLLEMLNAGAQTLVQDEKSSVVWGMPGSAFRMGASKRVVPLPDIAEHLLSLTGDESGIRAA
jgi:two-component system chemotaxis response regulator CheB